jgi:hypothetical protein
MIGASGYSRRKELLLQTAFAVENPSLISGEEKTCYSEVNFTLKIGWAYRIPPQKRCAPY